ncbi:TIGR03086 family metal-binding protein [Streptomyces europaeiscabiei]|uniref:TIGR03086 family metal-binding protein n=1 Tax=Streptomyces europaeiscabiei TaxID=146819 RepID=A0ABU4NG31_9ACTN|nr:TIGR03086 family metal-binding protein [Streptomyces europaeiscabiei]MDX3549404.1 TIGR03086 family metal-binding protein [Streptomyces europaeiscabiei]MDX3552081.1 TIGR03086 family metal-binding protein [Streptomyces europaeiscabiei]MDX3700873.1 TIGR03086 family metal-binding protein [Streptomyces europaeiscabiei]
MHVGDNMFWSIGEVARKTGLSVKLIRHWSDVGIVHPAHRTPAGYRLYGPEALSRLQLAQTLRGLGLGLATIRAVLEREDTLSQVAATHIDALETQIRALRTQQAVLRSVIRRDTTAEGLTTMTELAHMSAAERRAVIQDFVTETLGELNVPTYRRGLLAATPDLPAQATDEQVDAWLELGALVTTPALRAGLRRMAHYAAEHHPGEHDDNALRQAERVTDDWLRRVDTARDQGIAPDSPAADPVVTAVMGTWIPTQTASDGTTPVDGAEARSLLLRQLEVASDPHMERYWQLLCVINGHPVRPSMAAAGQWLTTALRAHPEPGARAAQLDVLYDAGEDTWEPAGVLHACDEVLDAVGLLVSAVEPEQFDRRTPCADWDVRTLLNHLIWENLLWASLADGAPRSDFTADHIGADHIAAFRSASRAARSAFARPGMLVQRYGPAPGRRLVEQLVIEMLVHGWDLAQAVGHPYDTVQHLAETALPVVREIYGPLPRTAAGSFAAPQPTPANATPLDHLAACLGRTVT